MKQEYSGSERRKFKRMRVGFVVYYSVSGVLEAEISIGGVETNALMLDLGEGGTSIVTNRDIPEATELFIRFTLIAKFGIKKMNFEGIVVNRSVFSKGEYRLGIQFVKISKEDKGIIAKFVEEELKR